MEPHMRRFGKRKKGSSSQEYTLSVYDNGGPTHCDSLTMLPTELIVEVMKRLGRVSLASFINAKATCKTLRDVGERACVVKKAAIKEVPMLCEVGNPDIERVLDSALIARNLQALFRHAFVHSVCAGGNFKYGYQLLKNTAKKGYHNAVYVWSLLLWAHSGCASHNYGSDAVDFWDSIYEEERVHRVRDRLQAECIGTFFGHIDKWKSIQKDIIQMKDYSSSVKLKDFFEWLLKVGEGKVGNSSDGVADIEIPKSVLITETDNHLHSIVMSTYPNLNEKLFDSQYLTDRASLAPTMDVVDQINDYMLTLLDGQSVDYYSSDSISKSDAEGEAIEDLYDTEFLNTIKCSGLPNHKHVLKVGVPIMLIRNIDQAAGLCNGTRLRTTVLGKHFIKGIALNDNSVGEEVLIHRMNMNPSDTKLPFRMNRRQFSVILSFAMTINKSHGQSMSNVGLYLPNPVFSHGQLYVAMSRVKTIDGLKSSHT